MRKISRLSLACVFFLQITEHEYLICCQPHRHSTTRAETIRIADKRRFDPFAADGCVSVWQQHFRVCEIAVGAAKTIDSFFFLFLIIHIIHKKLDITGV